jgi:hypothetical protein
MCLIELARLAADKGQHAERMGALGQLTRGSDRVRTIF